jgi:hypothetical protein
VKVTVPWVEFSNGTTPALTCPDCTTSKISVDCQELFRGTMCEMYMPLMVVVGESSQVSSEKTLLVAYTQLDQALNHYYSVSCTYLLRVG